MSPPITSRCAHCETNKLTHQMKNEHCCWQCAEDGHSPCREDCEACHDLAEAIKADAYALELDNGGG